MSSEPFSAPATSTWEVTRLREDQIRFLHEWLTDHPDVQTADSCFYLSALGEVQIDTLKHCGAGSMTCLVDPAGDVSPCAFTQWDHLASGNVVVDGFQAAWNEIANRRSQLDDHEGSPAVAMESSDPNSEDPQLRVILSSD